MSECLIPLNKEMVLAVHAMTIERFGGTDGLRDGNLLDSALAQPFQTFGGKELYPGAAQKAARCAFGIASNHPFVDGNKRTAAAVLGLFLRLNGFRFAPAHSEFLSTMLGVADGSISFEGFAAWVEANAETVP